MATSADRPCTNPFISAAFSQKQLYCGHNAALASDMLKDDHNSSLHWRCDLCAWADEY